MLLSLQRVNQIGYLVNDAASTAEKYKSLFNTNSPVILDVEVSENFEGKQIPPYRIRIALITLGETQLEFIQLLEGNPKVYTDFLQQCGEGLHHVGINVPNLTTTLKAAKADGFQILWSGIVYSVPFAYLDTQKQFSTILELIEVRPPKPLGT